MPKKSLAIIIVVAATFLGIIAFSIFYIVQQSTLTASVDIEASPLSSVITINDKNTGQGITKLKPGDIVINISLKGFIPYKTSLHLSKGDNKYIGVVLKSDSADTADWYQNHPADESMAEKVSGKQFDSISEQQVKAEPFISMLPFISAGFEFRIDYGAATDSSSKPVIYIQTATQQGRDDALTWIKSSGFDPTTMNIVYIDNQP
jgi:hypothetical protein